ncbi:MAG: NAD-dependent epimerase/dehydratase family protein [Treponema sp.]|jgi:UDP-glucuronate 4-epimerase|nr:NAD-dependent epimerase/dehydratase family protein [Treponema sp.]
MKLLITGTAGFIGYHLTKRLAAEAHDIVGFDNINDYYDVELKYGRLSALGITVSDISQNTARSASLRSTLYPNVRFVKADLSDAGYIKTLFETEGFDMVLHLAAQAGVRYSLTNPDAYINSNIQGFLNILEAIRLYPVKHLIYASSSSVYGLNTVQPFSETHRADHPASLYAVSKRTNELMAYSYAHLYNIPSTGLRFFTVYGPWGRPDMAPFLFTKAILEGTPINVFNNGDMRRDFTYIDDIVESMVRLLDHIPKADADWDGIQTSRNSAPAAVYNIGHGSPVNLLDFINLLETELGVQAQKQFLPMQHGDVPVTWADCAALEQKTGYRPRTAVQQGIALFAAWYRTFYGL